MRQGSGLSSAGMAFHDGPADLQPLEKALQGVAGPSLLHGTRAVLGCRVGPGEGHAYMGDVRIG